jgi:signal transduction histidine kinase
MEFFLKEDIKSDAPHQRCLTTTDHAVPRMTLAAGQHATFQKLTDARSFAARRLSRPLRNMPTNGVMALASIAMIGSAAAAAAAAAPLSAGVERSGSQLTLTFRNGSQRRYLLWSWRRLAVLMRDLYLRADAMQVGTATSNASNASARAPQDGWGQVVDALDRGRDAERQMQQQRAEALQLLSHDLRAPQSAILALLQGQPSTDEERALLNERIERQVRTSLGLADDFVLQMRARDDRYVLQDVDLAQLMTEVYERAWPLARKRNLKLVLTLPGAQKNGDADTAYWLPIEPRLMARAFFNLIENAIKYSRESGRVEFALEGSSAGPVVVTVTDEGVGIAAEDLPRLFDRYSRFNAASGVLAALPGEAESAGHGLGLSLVKTVVERHGGTVACRSELGYGTLFTVTLPRPSTAEPTPSAASA